MKMTISTIHSTALFRLTVLGQLASREEFQRGELKRIIFDMAKQRYDIPGSRNVYLSEKTIEAWYYRWKKGGIEALEPAKRIDKGQSKLPIDAQEMLLTLKRENPKRSLNELKRIIEDKGLVAKNSCSRSAIHRLLKCHGISRPTGAASEPTEHRSYVAKYAGDICYGDVMHGPKLMINGRMQKVYLVSLMDDASRLITHSAFCLGETALDIEAVLKQAVLKRGLPTKLVVDNGAAYRSQSLQGICARLEIRLIYCRPYAPEGKGKLERWHRTVRQQFIHELNIANISSLEDLNSRLWAWLAQIYHVREHAGLEGLTPLQRWQQDLAKIRPLGNFSQKLDEIFLHRYQRKVRKDGTISYGGQRFEVDYCLSGHSVLVIVDPHSQQALRVEDADGNSLGAATPLDIIANNHRQRHRPDDEPTIPTAMSHSSVESALEQQEQQLSSPVMKEV